MSNPLPLFLGALLGFVGVALGAWGAHGASFDPRAQAWWETAVQYQQIHAAVLIALGVAGRRWPLRIRAGAASIALGAIIFSGTLYVMALGGPRILGAVTPIGGLGLLVGWFLVGWEALIALRRHRDA